MSNKFCEGSVVEISLPDGRTAIGWIVHISKVFKDAVGFFVLGIRSKAIIDDVKAFKKNPVLKALGPLYTSIKAIEHYGWKVIDHVDVTENAIEATRRDVGGNMYILDRCVGPTHGSGQRVQPMQALGMPIVYHQIEIAFPVGTDPRSND